MSSPPMGVVMHQALYTICDVSLPDEKEPVQVMPHDGSLPFTASRKGDNWQKSYLTGDGYEIFNSVIHKNDWWRYVKGK